MEPGTQHHVRDVGRILLELQSDLRGLRSSIKQLDGQSNPSDAQRIEHLLEKAESDLRAKADMVLSTAVNTEARTLPLLMPRTSHPSMSMSSSSSRAIQSPGRSAQPSQQHRQIAHDNTNNTQVTPSVPRKTQQQYQQQQLRRRKAQPIRSAVYGALGQSYLDNPTKPGARQYIAARLGVPLSKGEQQHAGIEAIASEAMPLQPRQRVWERGAAGTKSGVRLRNPAASAGTKSGVRLRNPAASARSNFRLDLSTPPSPSRPNLQGRGGGDTNNTFSTTTTSSNRQDVANVIDISPPPPSLQPNNKKQSPSSNAHNHDLHEAVNRIRDYNELLDTYSLHQFIIRRGKTLKETPEFQSFMRKHAHIWGPIGTAIVQLEELFTLFDIPVAYVDGQKLVKLAMDEISSRGADRLLGCITNGDRVNSMMRTPGRQFLHASSSESNPLNSTATATTATTTTATTNTLSSTTQNGIEDGPESLSASTLLVPPPPSISHAAAASAVAASAAPTAQAGAGRATEQQLRVFAARDRAATRIQASARRFARQSRYMRRVVFSRAASRIQRGWRAHHSRMQTRAKVSVTRQQRSARFNEMQLRFAEDWPAVKTKRRVVVHIPSLSLEEHIRNDVALFTTIQNTQLARLCETADPLVDIIYVCPFPLAEEVLSYYHKVLTLGGVKDPNNRIKIIVPENSNRLPPHFALSTVLFYSPRALRRIQRLVRGQTAYICPGQVGEDDRQLALQLGIPILAPHPEVAALLRSRSGAKSVFAEAQVSTAPCARDVCEYEELIQVLTRLILDHLHTDVWMLRIDDEFDGRGDACFNVGVLLAVNELRHERTSMMETNPHYWARPDIQAKATHRISAVLKRELPRRISLPTTGPYSTFSQFLMAFLRVGGMVDAVPRNLRARPSASVFIEPSGQVTVTSTHEKITSLDGHRRLGCAFPQRSVPHRAITGAASAVAHKLFSKHVIGHVTVHFEVFGNAQVGDDAQGDKSLRMWAHEIELGPQGTDVSFALFHFLMDGLFDTDSGRYILPEKLAQESSEEEDNVDNEDNDVGNIDGDDNQGSKPDVNEGMPSEEVPATLEQRSSTSQVDALLDETEEPSEKRRDAEQQATQQRNIQARAHELEEDARKERAKGSIRAYISINSIHHPGLATTQYRRFFGACRRHGVAFDLEERSGLAFSLCDSLAGGVLGALAVGKSYHHALDTMCAALKFFREQVGPAPMIEDDDTGFGFSRVIRRVRQLRQDETQRIQAVIQGQKRAGA